MDVIITEEQRQKVVEYLKKLLEIFDNPNRTVIPDSAPEPKESNTEYKTFNEWSDFGYRIKKGEKASRIEGVTKFHREQVREQGAKTISHQEYFPNMGFEDDVPF
jgi:hypothetical protein